MWCDVWMDACVAGGGRLDETECEWNAPHGSSHAPRRMTQASEGRALARTHRVTRSAAVKSVVGRLLWCFRLPLTGGTSSTQQHSRTRTFDRFETWLATRQRCPRRT